MLPLLLLLAAAVALSAATELPPLYRKPGFAYGRGDAPVVIDAFMDPLCPDSASAWPALKSLEGRIKDGDVRVVLHLMPLPYHHFSYLLSQGMHATVWATDRLRGQVSRSSMNMRSGDQTAFAAPALTTQSTCSVKTAWLYMDYCFSKNITETFTGEFAVSYLSLSMVRQMLSHGIMTTFNLTSGVYGDLGKGTAADLAARTDFKYAAAHGVSSTPYFIVNGFHDARVDEFTTAQEWSEYVDQLL